VAYLLDANTLSYAIRGEGDYRSKLISKNPTEIFTCSTVAYELWFGVNLKKSKKLSHAVREILNEITVLPFDHESGEICAKISSNLHMKGLHHHIQDMQIAAVAMQHKLIVVTRNVKDFKSISALKLEDWY